MPRGYNLHILQERNTGTILAACSVKSELAYYLRRLNKASRIGLKYIRIRDGLVNDGAQPCPLAELEENDA